MNQQSSATKTETKEIVITRDFNASRDLVWTAFTYPEWMKQWWGPKGYTAPVVQIDLRVGGKYLNCMRSPEGKDYWGTGVFREIVPNEKLVMTDSFADEKGNVVSPTYYGFGPDFPQEALQTITLEDHGSQTRLTIRHALSSSEKDRQDAATGWNESLDKLAEFLQNVTPEMKPQGDDIGYRPPGGLSYHSG
jgi:uncharacterized protein YndB with AHSA1/START domain